MKKLSKRERETLTTLYLFEDGHGVLVHMRRESKSGRMVHWVTVHEDMEIRIGADGGCVAVAPAALPFLKNVTLIIAEEESASLYTREYMTPLRIVSMDIMKEKHYAFPSKFNPCMESFLGYRVTEVVRKSPCVEV